MIRVLMIALILFVAFPVAASFGDWNRTVTRSRTWNSDGVAVRSFGSNGGASIRSSRAVQRVRTWAPIRRAYGSVGR